MRLPTHLARPARAICAGALVLVPAASLAQVTPSPGARIRITTRTVAPSVGTLVALRGDTLAWRPERDTLARAVPLADVVRLEVSRGTHRHTLQGALIGGAGGALVGAVIGYSSGNDTEGWFRYSAGQKAAMAATAFGALGAVIGTVGGYNTRGEDWASVPVRSLTAWIAPAAVGGRAGLVLGVRYRL